MQAATQVPLGREGERGGEGGMRPKASSSAATRQMSSYGLPSLGWEKELDLEGAEGGVSEIAEAMRIEHGSGLEISDVLLVAQTLPGAVIREAKQAMRLNTNTLCTIHLHRDY
jgi:hypothetical protein